MGYLFREMHFRNEGDISMVQGSKEKTRMEKSMNNAEDVMFNRIPILLVEEGRNAIWAWSFMRPKLEHCAFNFIISEWSVKVFQLVGRKFWDR